MYRILILLVLACGSSAGTQHATLIGEPGAPLPAGKGVITGTVRDAVNESLVSMVTVLAEQDGKVIAFDLSDFEGRFWIGPLSPGRYQVSTRIGEKNTYLEEVVVEAKQELDIDVTMAPQNEESKSTSDSAYGSIVGIVVDGIHGTAFPGMVISLSAPHLGDVVMTIANEHGEFHFRGLRPGLYTVSSFYHLAEQGTVEVRQSSIVVKAGEDTAVQLMIDLNFK